MTSDLRILREISNWKLEAKEEESIRYFFQIDDVASLRNGSKCFVLGRKGSGKTSIAENIRHTIEENAHVRALSFQHFPFNELYKHSDKNYRGSSQYITLWKYVLYSSICSMMADNRHIQPSVSTGLAKAFDLDFETALSHSISHLTSRASGLNIMGSGVSVTKKNVVIENGTPWSKRIDSLEKIIKSYAENHIRLDSQ